VKVSRSGSSRARSLDLSQFVNRHFSLSLVLLRQAKGEISKVEDGKVLLEQDGAVDLDPLALVALHAAEAGILAYAGVLDVGAVEVGDEAVVANRHAERGNVGVAGVDVPAGRVVHGGALDLCVVGFGDVVVDHHERGAGVGDGGAGAGVRHVLAADAVDVGRELPEAAAGVDFGGVQLALVLAGVDSAEFVGAGGIDVEVCGECLFFELVGDTFEERLLALGLDCVDYAEREAKQTVVVLVRDEGAGDGRGDLDGLPGRGNTPTST